jgi:acyl carrier protein
MSTASSDNEVRSASAREAVEASVREFILKQFPAARSRGVGVDDSLLTQGIIDSLGVLEVVTFIESEFQLTVSDDEMLSDHFESISRIADLVCGKRAREVTTWTS